MALPQPAVFRKSRVLLLGTLTTGAHELTRMGRRRDEKHNPGACKNRRIDGKGNTKTDQKLKLALR